MFDNFDLWEENTCDVEYTLKRLGGAIVGTIIGGKCFGVVGAIAGSIIGESIAQNIDFDEIKYKFGIY